MVEEKSEFDTFLGNSRTEGAERETLVSYGFILYYVLVVKDNMPSAFEVLQGFNDHIIHLLQIRNQYFCVHSWFVTSKYLGLEQH